MHVSVSDAKAQLTDLVRRAEAGEEVILTRHGQPAVRLSPVRSVPDGVGRLAVMQALRRSAARHLTPGPDAAHSQDFLYGEDGLPR